MRTYTVEDLCQRGPKYALALLLQHVAGGEEPFVTYGNIADHLGVKLGIPKVFPIHVGAVAGALMDLILDEDEDAPLINALVTQPDGIPGDGFGGFYDRHSRPAGGLRWKNLDRDSQVAVIDSIRTDVRTYDDWEALYRQLFGSASKRRQRRKTFTEKDGKPPETGRPRGKGESKEHKRLKAWALSNPRALGLASDMEGTAEADLLSGDRVDVLFSNGTDFVAVEVKSRLSSYDDLKRGLYQCVKYRAVKLAEELPFSPRVRAILVTEEALPGDLLRRARDLKIRLKVQSVNPPR